ncbi:MAG: hypothetical protein ACC651_10490 [Candidatus Scalindua sp.]
MITLNYEVKLHTAIEADVCSRAEFIDCNRISVFKDSREDNYDGHREA